MTRRWDPYTEGLRFQAKSSVLRALETEQSVRTPLWEAQVVSDADAGESINKRAKRKSICWGWGLSEQLRTRQQEELAQEHGAANQSLGNM